MVGIIMSSSKMLRLPMATTNLLPRTFQLTQTLHGHSSSVADRRTRAIQICVLLHKSTYLDLFSALLNP